MELYNTSENAASTGRKTFLVRVMMAFGALLMLGVTVGAMVFRTYAAPSPFVSLPDSVAPQVASAKLVGPTATNQQIQLSLSLRSKNEAGLRDYASQVAQPKSKLYHQYLTPSEYAQIFGADPTALATTEKFMQSNGFRLGYVASGGLLLNFTGTVAQAEAAFHVHINNYTQNGKTFYANADAARIPSALGTQLFNVAGLEDARQFHPSIATSPLAATTTKTVKPNTSVTCPTGPTVTGGAAPFTTSGLLPTNLQSVYAFPAYSAGSPGNGVWAGLIEFDGYQLSDVAAFANCLSSGTPTGFVSNINGSASSSSPLIINQNLTSVSSLPAAGSNYGSAMTPGTAAAAVSGDIETLLGLTPFLSHLTVYQNNPTTQGMLVALSTAANQDAVQSLGITWGMCESDVGFANASAEEYFFMQMALQGQSAYAATGNYGLYACFGDGNVFRSLNFSAQDPASDPFVTAVGGTELGVTGTAGAPGTGTVGGWDAEQPWNNYPVGGSTVPTVGQGFVAGAGGGGISQFWAAPSWQVSAKASYYGTNPNSGATTNYTLVGVMSAYNLNNGGANTNPIPARVVPDVSAVADPINSSVAIYCSVGSSPCTSGATTFTNVGGTGIATAIWTAVGVLADQLSSRTGLSAPAMYTLYAADINHGGVTANQYTTVLSGATSFTFCDYHNQLSAALNTGAGNALTQLCTASNAAGTLHNSQPFAAATYVASSFPQTSSAAFQQMPTAPSSLMYGNLAGFAVANAYLTGGTTFQSAYNALTGLGSPIVGVISSPGTATAGLAAYLAYQARVAIPRIYMVAQAQSSSTYWLGSYAFNPYVQNMPTYTQWYQLSSTQNFSGAPTIVDDATVGGTAQNLYIIGPSTGAASAFSVIQWNIATQTATVLTLTGATIPSSTTNNTSCTGVTAFSNATTTTALIGQGGGGIGIYCLTPAGNVYATELTGFNAHYINNVNSVQGLNTLTQAAWVATPVLSNVSSLPQVATDGANHYEILMQTTGTSYNVVYTATPISFVNTGVGGAPTIGSLPSLPTTCNSTPSIAYNMQTQKYAVACIAKDTNAMWANVFDGTKDVFNPFWTLLGQPSSSVTFLPGDAVAVDNVASDPGYGLTFYIAEGSDKGMYLSVVNTANSNFLGKMSGWQNVSLPGIFSTGAAADFANA